MKTILIQNCEKEGFGFIEDYLIDNKIDYSIFQAFTGTDFPEVNDFNAILIGGTPISVNEIHHHKFLQKECDFLKKAINNKILIFGVCFGGQILAKLLGAEVKRNPVLEIGIYEVELTDDGMKSNIFIGIPAHFPVFQWHGDTFDIPAGAIQLVKGMDCVNQAFSYENSIGIQFHLEVDSTKASKWAENYKSELEILGKSKEKIVAECKEKETQMKELLYKILDNFFDSFPNSDLGRTLSIKVEL